MQTGRTMLLQEVNSEYADLMTLVGEKHQQTSLEDRTVFEIHDRLVIHTVHEFWKKFQPCLYRYLDTERYKVEYRSNSITTSNDKTEKIILNEEYWFIRFTYYFLEGKQKKKSYYNPFSQLWSFRYDEDKLLAVKKIRSSWKYKWCHKEQDGLSQYEKSLFPKLIKDYDDGIFLLYFYITEKKNSQKSSRNRENKKIVFPCMERYEVEYIGSEEEETDEIVLDSEQAEQWQEYLRERLTHLNLRNPALLTECLRGDTFDKVGELKKQQMIYERYADFFQQVSQEYWNAVQPLLNQFLNIYFFFKQSKENPNVSLLITNCSLEKLCEPKYQERLRLYLESVNEKTYGDETVWQALVPGLKPESKKGKLTRERFTGTGRIEEQTEITEKIAVLMEVFGTYSIQTFLSMEGGKITFQTMEHADCFHIEETFIRIPDNEWDKFICPCYPDFTIIPKEQGAFGVAERGYLNDQLQFALSNDGSRNIYFPGLYIEASYVAAGVFASYEEKDEFDGETVMPKELCDLNEHQLQEYLDGSNGVTFTFTNECGLRNTAKIFTEHTLAFRKHNSITVREVKEETIKRRKQMQ